MILALALLAYLLGSIPFGKLFGLLRGVDIQKEGSGNIGFANAVRVLGWRIGIFVLASDILKGYLAVFVAVQYVAQPYLLLIAAAALLGHVFPLWLNFRGGKAVATGFGVTLVLSPICALSAAGVYLVAFSLARVSAVASLIGAFSMPLWALLYAPRLTGFFIVLALFAIYTHRMNIKKLVEEKLVSAAKL